MASQDLVLVTGAAGLLGSSICNDLRSTYRVVGLDVADPDPPIDDVTYLDMDVTSDESVRSAIQRVGEQFGDRIASVIHLAAYYDFSGEPSDLYDKVTVQGSRRFLKALAESFTVEQFAFSSSMLVHKPTEPGKPISEGDPLDAQWDYPQSKIDAEHALKHVHGDIPLVLLRVAGVYTDNCDSLPLGQQIRRIAEDEITAHVFPGDTSHGQSFVHLDDLVAALRQVVARRDRLENEEIFLLGEPKTYSYDELQREIARLLRGEDDWKTREIPETLAKSGAVAQDRIPAVNDPFIKPWMIELADDHYELDITRARKKLDWKPKRRLIETLPRMIAALQADPDRWYHRHGFGHAPKEVKALAGV